MKNISGRICAVCLILIVGVLAWEVTTIFIWKSQIAGMIELETYSLTLRAEMTSIFSKMDAKTAIELKEQAEENIRKRGNPYSLFR